MIVGEKLIFELGVFFFRNASTGFSPVFEFSSISEGDDECMADVPEGGPQTDHVSPDNAGRHKDISIFSFSNC